MTNLLFELQLDAPKNELIKSASDFENFTQYLPAQLQKIEIIEQSNDKIITKETLQFSSILKKQIEIQCEHTIDSNKIFTIRAGNVLGGGDWAKDRLIPDSITSLSKRKKILIRNKNSIRPWQFVLEPLSGILWLIVKMNSSSKKFNQSWNIGPNQKNHVTVQKIIEKI